LCFRCGIKEKVLAARRAGIKSVYLPHKNEKDVSEIAADTLEGVQVNYVKRMEDLLVHVLETKPTQDPVSFFTPAAAPAPPVIAA
jgi:ATP-dependent Lon protease